MISLLSPEFITLFLITILFLINKFDFNIRIKFFLVFIIFAESFSQAIFFYGKFNPLLSLLTFTLSLYVFYVNYNDFKVMRNATSKNFSSDDFNIPFRQYFVYFGIILFGSVILAEIHFFDGNFSPSSFLILFQATLFYFFEKSPSKYFFERNFIFFFINLVVFFLVLPEVIIKILTNTMGEETPKLIDTDLFVEYALAVPLVKILLLLNFVVFNNGQIIYYQDLVSRKTEAVVISESCTGIYSVFIFILASQSYLLAHNRKIDYSFLILSIIIIIISYFSNLFRMASIIIVGHYYGMEYLLYTHANLGWVLFSFWIFLLFYFLEKFYISKLKHKL